MRNIILLPLVFAGFTVIAQTKHPIAPSDVYRLQNISDPQPSPDGQWVAYVVTSTDTAKDKHKSAIWMVSWDGKEHVQLTNGDDASYPRWSPDGKYISFLSSLSHGDGDDDDDKDDRDGQVFLLD